jgi:HD superfamily phosphohydrolase
MIKNLHEIRDPIHIFIKLDARERRVLDSRPFQRLRYIHQLAMTYLVYPGASHKRFEHSLGVMELASRIFDVITNPWNIPACIKEWLPEITDEPAKRYWKQVLRMAALCHDIGHLPFSHAAEQELLPEGWDHERLSLELIRSAEMETLWAGFDPPLRSEDIVKLANGPKKTQTPDLSRWEKILAEIIVGEAFGADRIDYLLRDSYHTGVAYGHFDHYRLIDTLRILPLPPSPPCEPAIDLHCQAPTLGTTAGGLQSAEALLLARYFMFSQVYLHPVRRIYDIHLKDFLCQWLPNRKYPTHLENHLALTDNEVLSALAEAAKNPAKPGHEPANRIIRRNHFKLLYQPTPADLLVNPEAAQYIYKAAVEQFGDAKVSKDSFKMTGSSPDFPVLLPDERVASALSLAKPLSQIPDAAVDDVFIQPELQQTALQWLKENRSDIINTPKSTP